MSSLIRLNTSKIQTLAEINKEYPNSKVLVHIIDKSDITNLKGIPVYLSKDISSYEELCLERQKFSESNTPNIITGSYSYNKVGVQYEDR